MPQVWTRAATLWIAATLAGCANASSAPSPGAALAGAKVATSVLVEPDASAARAIERVELRIDGELIGASANGYIELPVVSLAQGDHRIALRVLLRAPADESGLPVVWSMSQAFVVDAQAAGVESSSRPAAPRLHVQLVVVPSSRAVANRFEVRFKGERVTMGAGSLPRVESFNGDPAQALLLGREEDERGPAEQLARVEAGVVEATEVLEAARKAKDVIRTTCVAERIEQMDLARAAARQHHAALLDAERAGDATVAYQERTKLALDAQLVEVLLVEVRQCSSYSGGSD